MKRPTNFEKIKNQTFKHNGMEYRLSIRKEDLGSTTQVWILPLDVYATQFTHVILFTINWNNGIASFLFPKRGCGVDQCLKSDPSHMVAIRTHDVASIGNFFAWCEEAVDKFGKLIKPQPK